MKSTLVSAVLNGILYTPFNRQNEIGIWNRLSRFSVQVENIFQTLLKSTFSCCFATTTLYVSRTVAKSIYRVIYRGAKKCTFFFFIYYHRFLATSQTSPGGPVHTHFWISAAAVTATTGRPENKYGAPSPGQAPATGTFIPLHTRPVTNDESSGGHGINGNKFILWRGYTGFSRPVRAPSPPPAC